MLAGGDEFVPAKDATAEVDTQEAALSFWEKGKTFRPQRAVPEAAAKGNAGRILRTVHATMKIGMLFVVWPVSCSAHCMASVRCLRGGRQCSRREHGAGC